MLVRRFAAAIGLLVALIASQMPEYVQQYRQRLGGAVDELRAVVADFDMEAAKLSLTREQAMRRLEGNMDDLARERGTNIRDVADREARLERQSQAFASSGPVSQYLILIEDFDARVGGQAYGDFLPAVPLTTAGILAGAAGLFTGWGLTHLVAMPLRRRRRPEAQRA